MRKEGAQEQQALGQDRPHGRGLSTLTNDTTGAELLRVVENATDDTWRNIRHELDRMHLVTLATADGQVAQRPLFFDFTAASDCPGTCPHVRCSNTTLIGPGRVSQLNGPFRAHAARATARA